MPVTLIVDGKGILMRETSSKNLPSENLLHHFLPQAKPEHFQCQIFEHEKNPGYRVSIARQDHIQQLLSTLAEQGVACRSVLCGIPVEREKLIEETQGDFQYASSTISTLEESSFRNLAWTLKNEFNPKWKFTAPTVPAHLIHRKEIRFFDLTKKLLLIVPSIILLSLIANLFIYDQLESEYVLAQSELEANKSLLDSIAQLEEMIQQRSMITGTSGTTGSIPAAYYADQIGTTIPHDITLSSLDIFPIIRDENSGKVLTLSFDTLMMEGSTSSSEALNKWIQNMNKLEWVDRVAIRGFQQSSPEETGNFEIQLITK